MAPARSDLLQLLGPVVTELGLDLEDVEVSPAGKRRLVRVSVDRDGGIGLDDVADVSRAVEAALDESDVLGQQPYVLEVGSPGVGRPLTADRHWHRAMSRLLEVSLTDGTTVQGRLVAVAGDAVTLSVAGKGHGGRPLDLPRVLAKAEIASAHVTVDFSGAGRTAPVAPSQEA